MQYEALRSVLFRLEPETAHAVTLRALSAAARLGDRNPLRQALPERPVSLMGLNFKNPLGLAAGFDKNASCIDGFAALGFGFIEVGTLTPLPQPGNPKPRLFRLTAKEALINRMGFNNDGVHAAIHRIKARRSTALLGVNIGKNRDTPVERAIDDYRAGLEAAFTVADYVAINLSSPNTKGLRDLQLGANFARLLAGLATTRLALAAQHERQVPLVVKISPDLADGDIKELACALLEYSVDGVIATNTTVTRPGISGELHAEEGGGLSGRPLGPQATHCVYVLRDALGPAFPIIACGGVVDVPSALDKIRAGATALQLYTGLVYRGPKLIGDILGAWPS